MSQVDRRKHARLDTNQEVDCRNLEGKLPEVWLVDLTISGCQVIVREGQLVLGQQVVIRPDGFDGLAAIVRWMRDDRAGIEFASELDSSVFDHLIESKLNVQQSEAITSLNFTDRFGRILPGLRPLPLYRSLA